MLFLLIQLVMFAAIAAGMLAYALRAPRFPTLHVMAPCSSVMYQNVHRSWCELGQVRDWEGLKAQVRRWHEVGSPGWGETDIEEVARRLNQAVFRFAEPASGS